MRYTYNNNVVIVRKRQRKRDENEKQYTSRVYYLRKAREVLSYGR